MNTSPDPDQTPEPSAIFTRRSILRGLGVTALTAALAPRLLQPTPAEAVPLNRAARRALASSAPARRVRKLGAAASSQPTPYLLTASSELTEEFFLTNEVMINDGDDVYPFANPFNGNQVEAVVFASGTMSHLRRDPTSSTGWSYTAINLNGVLSTVTNVAIAANSSSVFLLAVGAPGDINDDPNGDPAWLTWLDGPATWDTGTTISYYNLGIDPAADQAPIKGGISPDGTPYFATTSVGSSGTTVLGWVYTGSLDYNPLVYQELLFVPASAGTVVDFAPLYDNSGTSTVTAPTGFLFVLTSTGVLSVYAQAGVSYNGTPMTNAGTTGVTELLWVWASPTSSTNFPGYAYQTSSGTGFVDENGNDNNVADITLAASNAVSVWLQNGLYTVNLLDDKGKLQMIQELSSSGTGSWATPIPIVPNLEAVFGVPTDPNQNTLFAVATDTTLNVLTLGTTGWTQSPVLQESEELYDFAAYKVQGVVTDSNGTAVPAAQVTINTDRPVGAWTPSGNLAIAPGTPLTVTADVKGEITFSIPADELDCAMLTLQALDDNGNATGSPLLVTADNDVRAFLGGTAALGDLGSLSGPTLTSATQADGVTPLFPTLNDTASASAAAQALNQLIKAGSDAQNGTTTATAFTLNLNAGKPTYTPGAAQAVLRGTRLTFSFDHLFHSIGHAIRHGAAKLAQAVIRAAENAAGWVVDLAIQIGDDIVTFTDLAIADMQSAFHVIGGFFATLGADIDHAIAWLKTNVLGLIQAASAAAAQIQTWITVLGTNVTTAINEIKITTDTWFHDQETDAHNAISYLKNLAEGTLGGPTLPTPTDTGSASDQSNLGSDLKFIGKVMNDAPGKWLLDKLLSYLPVTDTGPDVPAATYQPLVQALADDWGKAIQLSDDLLTFLKASMSDAFSTDGSGDGTKLNDTTITQWFTDLDNVVADGLDFLDAIADTLFALLTTAIELIETYFTYQYNLVASMGILGYILEKAGVDIHFSLSEIVSWVVAFPATLVAKCRGFNALFPASTGVSSRTGGLLQGNDPDGWQLGLGITGAVAQGVWGMADLVGDLQQFYDEDSKQRGTPSGIIDYFDILCPLVQTIVLWPGDPDSDGRQAEPFKNGLAKSTTDWGLLPAVIVSAVLPSLFQAATKPAWSANVVNSLFPKSAQSIVTDYMNPVVQMVGGTVNTVLGATYSGENDFGTNAIASIVLGNLSYIGAPLATKVMNETTDDVSTLVKMLIDAGGNIGAAICMAEATSLPTP